MPDSTLFKLPLPVRVPRASRGGRVPGDVHRREIYRLKDKAAEAIQRTAVELLKLTDHDNDQLWPFAVPEILYSMLDRFDRRAAYAAAYAFIRDNEDVGLSGSIEGLPLASRVTPDPVPPARPTPADGGGPAFLRGKPGGAA